MTARITVTNRRAELASPQTWERGTCVAAAQDALSHHPHRRRTCRTDANHWRRPPHHTLSGRALGHAMTGVARARVSATRTKRRTKTTPGAARRPWHAGGGRPTAVKRRRLHPLQQRHPRHCVTSSPHTTASFARRATMTTTITSKKTQPRIHSGDMLEPTVRGVTSGF